MEDKNYSYKNYFNGREILPELDQMGLDEKPPFKGVPDNPSDYQVYQEYMTRRMQTIKRMSGIGENEGFLKLSAGCFERDAKLRPILFRQKQKPEHKGADFVFSCPHVYFCDPINPEVMRMIPFERGIQDGYFLCNTCFKILERKRLDFDKNVFAACGLCIGESLSRIMQKDVGKFIDLSKV